MPNPEPNQWTAYIDSVIEATRLGKIVWRKANPTTFVWVPPTNAAQLTLQRIDGPRQTIRSGVVQVETSPQYILQAYQIPPTPNTPPRVTINSDDGLVPSEKLAALFNAAREVELKGSLDFLRSLIPP